MPERLLHPEHRGTFWAIFCSCLAFFLACSIAGAVLYNHLAAQSATNHEVCVALNNENKLITDSLHRSLKNTPKLSYYKHHPRELAVVLAEIRHELDEFKPRTC